MCFLLSLTTDDHDLADHVRVPLGVETLLYSSSRRFVLISLDLVICSRASRPITLLATHPDCVEGFLSTGEWADCQTEHAKIVQQIYGAHWEVDWPNGRGRLEYTDPMGSYELPSGESASPSALVADALTDATFTRAERCNVPPDIPLSPGARELSVRPADQKTCTGLRPFTSFPIGPVPPESSVFARYEVLIRNDAYDRLVGTDFDTPFAVVGPNKVRQHIENFELNLLRADAPFVHAAYDQYFAESVLAAPIEPERYQVILLQSKDPADRAVHFRPTSSNISEMYIANAEARERASWFNAWSQDFSMILMYGEENCRQEGTTLNLPRLPLHVSAAGAY